VSACDIVPRPFSDHCALKFSVSVPDVIPRDPGLWKVNVSILEEREYFYIISGLNGSTVKLFTLLWPNGGKMEKAR